VIYLFNLISTESNTATEKANYDYIHSSSNSILLIITHFKSSRKFILH